MIIQEPRIVKGHTCPACGMADIEPYGTVDTPPIAQQMIDHRHQGFTRLWLSERHCCPECNEIFDVVVINKLLAVSADES